MRVQSSIWRTGLEVRRKIVLLKFADHADDDGRNAWPSKATVAAACGLSLESVKRIIRELRKDGILVPEGECKGGAGKTVNYRIDFERAAELHPPVKPRDLAAKKKGVTETPLSEENSPPPAENGVTETPFSEDRKRGSGESKKGVTGDEKRGHSSDPQTIQNHQEPSSAPGRARDPAGAAHPAAPEDQDGAGGDPPVKTLWREREAAIRAKIGDVDFRNWFTDAIPHADEAGVYILAVRSPFMVAQINGQFARILAGVLGRREVRAEFHDYARIAAHNRKQRESST